MVELLCAEDMLMGISTSWPKGWETIIELAETGTANWWFDHDTILHNQQADIISNCILVASPFDSPEKSWLSIEPPYSVAFPKHSNYPLVNCQITNWKITIFKLGKSL